VLPFEAATFKVNGETNSVASPAAWVMVTSCEVTPGAETVTIAVRSSVVSFFADVNVTVPFPLPDAVFTANHVWSETTDHDTFDKTSKVAVLPSAAGMFKTEDETERIAFPVICVTVTVCEATPGAETVIMAARSETDGLVSAVMVTAPLPLPDDGLSVNHG
jgi:hypothetical protein